MAEKYFIIDNDSSFYDQNKNYDYYIKNAWHSVAPVEELTYADSLKINRQ